VKELTISWQRLVSPEGETCLRCGATQAELERAVATLTEVLRPLGIMPVLEMTQVDEVAFRADPSQSNRIWIAGQPIEDWLNATSGSTRCCAVCGDLPCRTVEIRGEVFETIPERLLLRAALIATAQLLA